MNTLTKIAALVAVPVVAMAGLTTAAMASLDGDNDRIVYRSPGEYRLVVKGRGCFDAEDMTKLRLVEYAPSQGKIVYRCIRP